MNTITVSGNKIESNFDLVFEDNVIVLSDLDEVQILYYNADIKLKFIVRCVCKIFEYIDHSQVNNKYVLEDNCTLNRFSVDSSLSTIIDLDYEGVCLNYYYATINENDHCYSIDINHNKKHTIANVVNHGINYDNKKLDFLINSNIFKESNGTLSNQDSKIILMKDNNSSIKPNLFVDNDDISASHSSFIGYFDKELLFYLASRGINKNDSIKLLSKAFLLGHMDINFLQREMILKNINDYWR